MASCSFLVAPIYKIKKSQLMINYEIICKLNYPQVQSLPATKGLNLPDHSVLVCSNWCHIYILLGRYCCYHLGVTSERQQLHLQWSICKLKRWLTFVLAWNQYRKLNCVNLLLEFFFYLSCKSFAKKKSSAKNFPNHDKPPNSSTQGFFTR